MSENISITAFTALAQLPGDTEALAAIVRHLEVLRPHIRAFDDNGLVWDAGTDEQGFTEQGDDMLLTMLINGYEAIKGEEGVITAMSVPKHVEHDRDLWLYIVGGNAEQGVPFDAWYEMWFLLQALEYAPALKIELGIYGLGILDQRDVANLHAC